ncbi:hypothetical protein ACFCWY_08875 [Streptomyces sp. NPDC056362]|uniref:hypothetical protein n=1 Tax=unclassified Streptomyces TaxID=2593676 RepID=UPI0035E231A4
MSRDHGRIVQLFGREYEWRWENGRLTLEPDFWQLGERRMAAQGIRPWFDWEKLR